MSETEDACVTGDQPEMQAQALVELSYQLVLKRAPDAEGLAQYAALLTAGHMHAVELLRELMNSDEAKEGAQASTSHTGPGDHAPFGILEAEQARTLVVQAFERVLRRTPELEALTHYSEALVSGLTPSDLYTELLASDEFGIRAEQHAPVARRFVDETVRALVGRPLTSERHDELISRLIAGNGLADLFRSCQDDSPQDPVSEVIGRMPDAFSVFLTVTKGHRLRGNDHKQAVASIARLTDSQVVDALISYSETVTR